MAEPARKINTQASDRSASSLRGADLRILQGGASSPRASKSNRPVLHPVSQLQLARDLEEDKMRDRSAGTGDAQVSDDTLKSATDEGGGSVLELEGKSYANREETSEETEVKRQRKQAQVAARFLHPDIQSESIKGSTEIPDQGLGERKMFQRGKRVPGAIEQDRFRAQSASMMQSAQRMEVMRRSRLGEATEGVDEARRTANEARRWWALITKILELESVILALWVFIAMNIETWNILIFRVKLPDSMNTALSRIGLNLDVDPEHPFTPINLTIVGVTLFLDIVLTLYMILQVALFLFVAYWLIYFGGSILSFFGLS